jgi:hypothetical protein
MSIGLALATCTAATVAFAGRVYHSEVYVFSYPPITGFGGTVTGARYSSDSVQEITCQVYQYLGSTPSAGCYARDAAGTYRSCVTTDPGLISIAATVNSTSFIDVTFNSNGQCNYISVQNGSLGLP